jgi:hypothetical protein
MVRKKEENGGRDERPTFNVQRRIRRNEDKKNTEKRIQKFNHEIHERHEKKEKRIQKKKLNRR